MEPASPHAPQATGSANAAGREEWPPSPVVGIGFSAFARTPRVRLLTRLLELAAGVAFVLVVLPTGSPKYTAGLIATFVCGLAWLMWILVGSEGRRGAAALIVLSAAGGVCAAAHDGGMLFVVLVVAATAFSSTSILAAALFVPALAGFLLTNLAAGTSPEHLRLLVEIGLLGLFLGFARRQLHERGREATLLETAERRATLAGREAQLAAERNRLGREIHDVLAHTLGAVSIQLTALDSRLDSGDPPEALRARVRGLHALVGDGLREARDAVRALRDDKLALESQVERLCALHGAEPRVEGRPRPLPAEAALALYRVVQESLTNAAKHAPGTAVTVSLAYREEEVAVSVENDPPPGLVGPLAGTGGGHGLDGMRTRVELAGGSCVAGPHGGGWRVTATVPSGELAGEEL